MENALPEESPCPTGAGPLAWQLLIECASPRPDDRRLRDLLRCSVDWPRFLALADDHGILALAAARLSDGDAASAVPADTREKLRAWNRAQLLFSLSITAEMIRLLDRLSAAGIAMLVIKGPVLSVRCYGDPALRQYGDLDVVVRSQDIRRSTEVMMELGFEPHVPLAVIAAAKIPGEYVFVRHNSGVLVEFHTERTFRYHPLPPPLEKLFERQTHVQVNARQISALSSEDELILISIHAAKHLWVRLMWVADVAALVTRQHLDWRRVRSSAREVGAERMLHIALQLAAELFSVELPAEIAEEIGGDAGAARIAARIAHRLPWGDSAPFGIFQRAAFRMAMRGGLLRGAAYLLRLSVSPTEEDWVLGAGEKRFWLLDALARPLRLARKYSRKGKA